MTSQRGGKSLNKLGVSGTLHAFIEKRRNTLGLTWEELEQDIKDGATPRFGTITARAIQTWGAEKKKPKYKKVMAALLALELDEGDAFDVYQRIWTAHGLKPTTVSARSKTEDGFPWQEICQSVLDDPKISQLPAVFETDTRLPVATTFVDLRVVERRAAFSRDIVQPMLSPGQQIWEREKRLRLPRRPAQQVLDGADIRSSVLIGGPGSGKSALLRRAALDIAKGQWRGAKVPLFVELRRFWARRSADQHSNLTLLGFALEERLPHLRKDPESRDRMEYRLLKGEISGVLLLADGLDEISSVPEAVETIYGELEAIAHLVPWIASSRPTGLQRMISGSRRLELDPLSIDAIERLVIAWSAATGAPDGFAGQLYAEIAANNTLRQMAGNPFLLTALCYLRYADIDRPLPDSRSTIYQRLFEQIARQAQLRHSDRHILDGATYEKLEQFCHALYADTDTPKQVFSEFDWQRLSGSEIDLRARVLPARLLTAFNENDTDYHFMHLSLQEHLIARYLLKSEIPDISQLRFHPAWRSVFRSYGALLHSTGYHNDFRELVKKLYDDVDLLGLSLFNLAEIFADAGIKDTTAWLGEDLRSRLWTMLTEGWNEIPAQALEALRVLDPEFLEAEAITALEELADDLAHLKEEYPEDFETAAFKGEPYQQYGFEETQAPRMLARAGTDRAHSHIRDLFLNGPQPISLAMATAYADIARPSDRNELAKIAKSASADSDLCYRLFAFAVASPAAELVPFLGRVADAHRETRNDTWDRAIGLLMQIGGEDSVEILKRFLERDIAEWNIHPKALREKHSPIPQDVATENNKLVSLIARLPELDPNEHTTLLDVADDLIDTERYGAMLYGERLKIGRIDDKNLLRDLASVDRRDEALSALIRAPVKSGKPASNAVRKHLFGQFENVSVNDQEMIAEIEAASIRVGGKPIGVDRCLDEAKRHWLEFRTEPDRGRLSMLINRLGSLLSPAQEARDFQALDLIYSVLSDYAVLVEVEPELAEMQVAMLLDALRDILIDGTVQLSQVWVEKFGSLLKEMMFSEQFDVTQNAATALVYLDLPALLQLRGAATVEFVLEEISAEEDIMIFKTFWAGRDGKIHNYQDDRPGIVVMAQDERGDEAQVLLKHQLIGLGFATGEAAELKERFIMGVVMISPDEDAPDADRAEALESVVSMLRDEWEVPVIEWDLPEIEDGVKEAAVKIKSKLDALYETKTDAKPADE